MPAFDTTRVASAVINQARQDGKLPGPVERLFGYNAKGRDLYPQPIFLKEQVDRKLTEAGNILQLCNQLAHTCSTHSRKAICLNGAGMTKSKSFEPHKEATLQEYSKTLARYLAFLESSWLELRATLSERLSTSECTVVAFLLHEAAHNPAFKDPDVFQHHAMQLQRVLRGLALEQVNSGSVELVEAVEWVNPTNQTFSFFPLYAVYKQVSIQTN